MATGQDLEIYPERKDFVLNVCSKSKELLVQYIMDMILFFLDLHKHGVRICSKSSYTNYDDYDVLYSNSLVVPNYMSPTQVIVINYINNNE